MANDDSELTILLYHGVSNTKPYGIENFSGKHISAVEFEHQMRWIKQERRVLSIEEIVELSFNKKKWPSGAVVISFDDGFLNNATVAAPILEVLGLPAVFYICSGMIDTSLMFWVDMIEDCINRSSQENIILHLKNGEKVDFTLDSLESRIEAVLTIKRYCKNANVLEKNRVLGDLIDQAAVEPYPAGETTTYQMMSWSDVRDLDKSPLFTIGGHSLYHEIMTAFPYERLNLDIRTCLGLLEYNLEHPVHHYSYPEGQENHFSESIIGFLKENGVKCCPSAIKGENPNGTDLFHLRRIMPGFMGTSFPFYANN